MGLTATVAGASGYAGGELLRLLTAHQLASFVQALPGALDAAFGAGGDPSTGR